ncbi:MULTISPECIES: type II toxin-antitoxin system PemK/MazF family toxin [Spirulina sp. CCY15215]|uniref:type II toxin-antitoxin system PemK/MazF family toxin n=1 Tax=Spirulina sp. CCY15215 TaxID=2767591 RepID=UPI001950C4AD|nr:type II toxin-antitoxin system PemK/MazF family toxin [Spirulina major]
MFLGEVWLVNLNPTIGAEIGKIRPVVIVSNDEIGVLPLLVIVPITGWQDRYTEKQWMVRLDANRENGLKKRSAADTFQVRSISVERLIKKLGRLSETTTSDIAFALAIVLNIGG